MRTGKVEFTLVKNLKIYKVYYYTSYREMCSEKMFDKKSFTPHKHLQLQVSIKLFKNLMPFELFVL